MCNKRFPPALHRPDIIDEALLRPGRLDRLIYVSPPNHTAREDIFHIHTRNMPVVTEDVLSERPDLSLCAEDVVDFTDLAARTSGFSGAEVASVCREAALAAMEENPSGAQVVARRHFEVSPSFRCAEMLSYSSPTSHATRCLMQAGLGRINPQITEEMLSFYRGFSRRK